VTTASYHAAAHRFPRVYTAPHWDLGATERLVGKCLLLHKLSKQAGLGIKCLDLLNERTPHRLDPVENLVCELVPENWTGG
jgi:hypothetical protein